MVEVKGFGFGDKNLGLKSGFTTTGDFRRMFFPPLGLSLLIRKRVKPHLLLALLLRFNVIEKWGALCSMPSTV